MTIIESSDSEDSSIETTEELLVAYANGQRIFEGLDADTIEGGSVQGLDLTGIEFHNCFFYLDYRDANLTNSKFIDCNIKGSDFRGANLKNALIKGCLVEGTLFKGAKLENFQFEENEFMGTTLNPHEWENFVKNS